MPARSMETGGPVLITGGAGFIGACLAHRLASNGETVRVYDSLARRGAEKNATWLRDLHPSTVEVMIGDVRDSGGIQRALEGVSAVFHFAAFTAVTSSLTSPLADFDVNARGTLGLLEAVRASGRLVPFVFTSTNKVYGPLDDLALERRSRRYVPRDAGVSTYGVSEERQLAFQGPHGCSKGAADQYVLDYAHTFGLPALVFRMSCVYGARQFGNEDQGWVAHFLTRALRGEPVTIYGDGLQVRDILYVDDLIEALLLARTNVDDLRGSAFNIGGGPDNTTSLVELIDQLQRRCGVFAKLRFEPWRTADQRYYVSDVRAFAARTGWVPRTGIAEGLEHLRGWVETLEGHEAGSSRSAAIEALP